MPHPVGLNSKNLTKEENRPIDNDDCVEEA